VSPALFAVNRSSLPARTVSFMTPRAARGSPSWICASLCLSCLICFLYGAAATAQHSSGKAQQGPSPAATTSAGAVQANAGSAVAKNAVTPSEPPTPDPALAPARLLLQQGKLSQAEAATRNYLQAHADSAEAHFLLGFILFREIGAQWLEAGKTQEGSSPYNSGDATGSLAAFRDAKARESLAEFTAGARYRPAGAFDLKIVALDYILLKHNMDADRWLTRSVQANPRDVQAWYYLGRTKYSEGRFPQAIEAFEHCLKLEPHNVQAETNVGVSYEALFQRDQAIQAFENAIDWQTQTGVSDPDPFFELAHLYLEENQPEKAVPYLSQSIAISPKLCKAHEALGKAYSLLHRLPEAQAELEKAVALEPATASLRCLLGQIYRQEGMVSKAQAEFDRCVALQQTKSANPSGME
jgi:tetratricopeptide (TPR) repeat protein